jgi:hypothetical protein
MTVDVQGKTICVNQKVARAAKLQVKDGLCIQICTVTRINEGAVYLDNSKQPMKFPERLAIVERAPLNEVQENVLNGYHERLGNDEIAEEYDLLETEVADIIDWLDENGYHAND